MFDDFSHHHTKLDIVCIIPYIPHRIRVWYIYLHLPSKSTIHVGKYANPMGCMGTINSSFHRIPRISFRRLAVVIGAFSLQGLLKPMNLLRCEGVMHGSKKLGGGFKYFVIFTPKHGEMILFDEHIFQMGWFNHQPENLG